MFRCPDPFRQPVANGEARLVRGERGREVALRLPDFADLVERNRQRALQAQIAWIAAGQIGQDLPGLLGGGECARRIADRQKCIYGFYERRGLAELRSGVACPDLMSCSCRARAWSRMSLSRAAGTPTVSRNCCARLKTRPLAVLVAASSVSSACLRSRSATCRCWSATCRAATAMPRCQ